MGLPEALARTVAENQELIAAGYEIDAAEGRLRQARLAPNPELDATVQEVFGTDDFRGVDSAETTVTLGWILERGVRSRLVDAAQAGVFVSTAAADIARIDAAAETARRFLDCLAYQARLSAAVDAVRLAEETVAAVNRRVAAGSSPAAERLRAEADLARAELLEEDIGHELLSAYHRLAAQWGTSEPDFAAVTGDLATLPRAENSETLMARIEQNPELARFASEQRLNEAELRLQAARRRPSWRFYAGVRRFESTDDQALVGGITVPIAIRDRNQGRIAEARAELARTNAEAAATRVRLETTLFVLDQEFRHSLHVAGRLTEDVVPRIEEALAETERAYELGRYGYFELRAVQAELLDARSALIEASIDAHRTVIEIERLTGARLALPTPAQRGQP